jgi:hypothetical protein
MSKSTPLSDIKDVAVSEYRALSGQGTPMQDILKNNLNGQQLRPSDLDRVKVPSGGATSWEVPSLKGPESTRELVGIILATRDGKQYWSKKADDGGSSPPDCVSADLIHGMGTPGGDCQACAFNQFGSAIGANGLPAKGKACKETKLMFFIRPGDVLPLVVSVPATSLGNARKYFLRLAQSQLMHQSVVTKLTLKREQSGANPYAEIEFTYVRDLSKEEEARSLAIAQTMKSAFSAVESHG